MTPPSREPSMPSRGSDKPSESSFSRQTTITSTKFDQETEALLGTHFKEKNKSKKKKLKEGHLTTIFVTVSFAVLFDEDQMAELEAKSRRKKGVAEALMTVGTYHLEYYLLPGDAEPIKTDVVVYSQAAKVFPDKHEPKVARTWNDGGLIWVSWTHSHTLHVTEKLLRMLKDHRMNIKVWDTKDRMSSRAKMDRPKGFRLSDSETNGVKDALQTQCKWYLQSLQRGADFRALPSELMPESGQWQRQKQDETALVSPLPQEGDVWEQKIIADTGEQLRDYGGLGDLADLASDEKAAERRRRMAEAAKVRPEPREAAKSKSTEARIFRAETKSRREDGGSLTRDGADSPGGENNNARVTPEPLNAENFAQQTKRQKLALERETKRLKAEGVTQVTLNPALLFVGETHVTCRLMEPVNQLCDLVVSALVDSSLLDTEQMCHLKPLVVKLGAALEVPGDYAELQQRCEPVRLECTLLGCETQFSHPVPHGKRCFWHDAAVTLLGDASSGELHSWLTGPGLEVVLHDRTLKPTTPEITPSLFGDDIDDVNIANACLVTSKQPSAKEILKEGARAMFPLTELLTGMTFCRLRAPVKTSRYDASYADTELKVDFVLSMPIRDSWFELQEPGCFQRMVIHASRHEQLASIMEEVRQVNSAILKIPDYALSAYKLTPQQEMLDIFTGFEMEDTESCMLILEGLPATMSALFDKLDLLCLYNSSCLFPSRVYLTLDADVSHIKLHKPLEQITAQPLFFVRDMLPEPAFQALVKLRQVKAATVFTQLTRNSLFPTPEQVVSVDREFGVPLSRLPSAKARDIAANNSKLLVAAEEGYDSDTDRMEYDPSELAREPREPRNFIRENIEAVWAQSEEVAASRPPEVRVAVEGAGVYSCQTLNAVELAKNHIRNNMINMNQPHAYSHRVFTPVDREEVKRVERELSKAAWRHPGGWRLHHKLPDLHRPNTARIEELKTSWVENELNKEWLQAPLLYRDPFPWGYRQNDMDVWAAPEKQPTLFDDSPKGDRADVIIKAAEEEEKEMWKKKLLGTPNWKTHRRGVRAEFNDSSQYNSNQLDKLKPILKDSVKRKGWATDNPPSLSVLGTTLPQDASFAPVSYNNWLTFSSVVPRGDPIGKEFWLYHKSRYVSHNQLIGLHPEPIDQKPLVDPLH